MTLSVIFSMTIFALAASISPGPVNLVCLSSGTRYPLYKGLIFVTGATLGFVLLFTLIGLGLYSVLVAFPWIERVLRWAGIIFLLYLSVQLFRDDGQLSDEAVHKAPSFMTGAVMQWLNPKAWLASASGIGAYTSGNDFFEILIFAAIYLPVCWLSLSCWVYVGAFLRQYIGRPNVLMSLNKSLAVLLAASCVYLLIE